MQATLPVRILLFGLISILSCQTLVQAQIGGQPVAGVEIDAEGLLKARLFKDPTGQLTAARVQAARAVLTPELNRPSKLRKVSLRRLETAIAKLSRNGQEPTESMKFLAGLQRITHVFYYPQQQEIVIAGPAEGFWQDISGRAIGTKSGQSVLELRDLVVALRAFGPRSRGTHVVSVSIDSTPQGLQKMQQFLVSIAGRVRPNDANRIAAGLFESLGPQTVSINGVARETHFAQVLVEADYRMKLIGIGLEKPPAKITSYVERVNPRTLAQNALQRWYFVPDYQCVKMSQDEQAMELVGEGVKLIGEDEMVKANGQVGKAGKVNRASQAYVESFTKEYSTLARNSPVFGQLRDLIDMLVAAAFIKQQNYYSQANWDMPVFGSEQAFPVKTEPAIKTADPAVNVVWKGNVLMTPIGGGVMIHPQKALQSPNLLTDEGGQLQALRKTIDLSTIPADTWWWD